MLISLSSGYQSGLELNPVTDLGRSEEIAYLTFPFLQMATTNPFQLIFPSEEHALPNIPSEYGLADGPCVELELLFD